MVWFLARSFAASASTVLRTCASSPRRLALTRLRMRSARAIRQSVARTRGSARIGLFFRPRSRIEPVHCPAVILAPRRSPRHRRQTLARFFFDASASLAPPR